jgi:purine-nucleoside phosphorylase
MLKSIKETVSFIRNHSDIQPEVGIILGTGLGGLANDIDIRNSISFTDIPNFPVSTAPGHEGKLIFGILGGKNVMAMQGRFHYYEGYEMSQVTFPVRVMKFLGVKYLFVSNASGGMNPSFQIGDLMIQTDHINLLPNPLIGKHYDEFGERFPDMSETYDPELVSKALKIGIENGIRLQTGCYVGVTGPTLETPAEYRFFRLIGGDAVGMSTVPEIIVAHQMGMKCFAISIITDLGIEGRISKVTIGEVLEAAEKAAPKMTLILEKLIAAI